MRIRDRFSLFLALAGCSLHSLAFADFTSQARRLVGYSIVDVKTISGWRDQDGKHGEAFEGCNYGRVIFFADNKVASCMSYGYHYAYRPDAVILFKGNEIKMVVEDEVYDMSR